MSWLLRVFGPPPVRREWMFTLPRISPRADEYRDAGTTIGALIARLERRGYRLTVLALDERGLPGGAVDLATSLLGAAIWLGDARLGRRPAGVVLRVGVPTNEARTFGSVEAYGAKADACEELAMFVIAELDVLAPGITYQPIDSVLTPDSAADLRAVLPEIARIV
jgi:hypothetical protein